MYWDDEVEEKICTQIVKPSHFRCFTTLTFCVNFVNFPPFLLIQSPVQRNPRVPGLGHVIGSRLRAAHACTKPLSRWREGRVRASVTHEEMIPRFAAFSKQRLCSLHIWPRLLLTEKTRYAGKPHRSRQTCHPDRWRLINTHIFEMIAANRNRKIWSEDCYDLHDFSSDLEISTMGRNISNIDQQICHLNNSLQ